MQVSVWYLISACGGCLVFAYLWLRGCPLPVPDRGHRYFAVIDRGAAMALRDILQLGGLTERFTFRPGPTIQTVMSDNQTVIIQHTADVRAVGLQPNAISIVVSDPTRMAHVAARRLHEAGFTAQVVEGIMPEIGNKFVLVRSNAFDGFVVGFRRHSLMMGGRPGLCRLDDLADGASKLA